MWLIFKKEVLELTRDRKTLFFMVALPILVFPLLIGGAVYFMQEAFSEAQTKELNFALVSPVENTELARQLEEMPSLKKVNFDGKSDSEDALKAFVKSGKADFLVAIPANYSEDILNSGQITVKVYLNDAQFNRVQDRIREVLDTLAAMYQRKAFMTLGVDEDTQEGLVKPFVLEKVNVADKRESQGAAFGGMIPYFLFILCLQGAMIPAGDIGAGEKERGTLETLLLSPISRTQIVLGKFFTLCFAGVVSALVTVLSIAIWSIVLSQGMAISMVGEFMAAIGIIDFLLVFLMLVPLVAIFAAVLLSLSIYARSYKEAQGYMTPLVFVVIFPVMIALMPGIELKGVYAWIPLTNVALAIKELIKGTMDYFQLLGIFSSSVLLAGLLIAFCVHWFNREKVLFR
ncbi:ABC transporter permease [Agaribacter flavus]|uniref:ABC transporter permease n=1 Tax=Agaribacter flavus TaxID=1902781 RepID=A0ABV7FPZ1_9ALTE